MDGARRSGAGGNSSRRRSRSRSRERSSRAGHRDSRADSRSPPPRRSTRQPAEDSDANQAYPHSSTRGGYSSSYSTRGGPGGRSGSMRDSGGRSGAAAKDYGSRAQEREIAAQQAIKHSVKENRVYVGNLPFQVRVHELREFCSSVGSVVYAEIITLPNGMSKGCGVVEFGSREEALKAITELNEGQLYGRPVFLREDREDEARYGSAAVSARGSFPGSAIQTSGLHEGGSHHHGSSHHGGGGRPRPPANVPAVFAPPGPRGLFVSGMSGNIGWQDLKDLFRAAGEVVRADINLDHVTGESKGTGTVVMASKNEASTAIAMFNGYEFDGGRLEVREDRFFHINNARGGHGGGRGGRGGFGRGGGHHGGFSSRDTENLYGDYPGPDSMGGEGGMDDGAYNGGGGFGGRGGFRGGRGGGRGGFSNVGGQGFPQALSGPGRTDRNFAPFEAPPSTQIFVKNLPWSTSNEDLVELFQTTGTVQEAEVLWENGRSKGNGVVQFANIEEAETAIAKFQNYQYGGRPLGLAYNARWKDFSAGRNGGAATAAAAGDDSAVQTVAGGDNVDMGDATAQSLDTREAMMEGM